MTMGLVCKDYIAGFCPFGPNCKKDHLKSVIIPEQCSLKQLANFPDNEEYRQEVPKPSGHNNRLNQ